MRRPHDPAVTAACSRERLWERFSIAIEIATTSRSHKVAIRIATATAGPHKAALAGLLLTAAACAAVGPADTSADRAAAGDCHPDPSGGAAGPYVVFRGMDELVFISGQIGVDPAAGEAAPGFESQMKLALTRLEMALSDAGSSPADVLKATVYLADPADMAAMNRLYRDFFESRGAPLPARSLVPGLDFGNAIAVEIDVIARRAPCD